MLLPYVQVTYISGHIVVVGVYIQQGRCINKYMKNDSVEFEIARK